MSTSTEATKARESILAKASIDLVRYYLGGRQGLILLSVAALGSAMALDWGWLIAVGIAPLLVAFAPCAAVCALGLCMIKMGSQSDPTQSNSGAHGGAGTSPLTTTPAVDVRDETLTAAVEPGISNASNNMKEMPQHPGPGKPE